MPRGVAAATATAAPPGAGRRRRFRGHARSPLVGRPTVGGAPAGPDSYREDEPRRRRVGPRSGHGPSDTAAGRGRPAGDQHGARRRAGRRRGHGPRHVRAVPLPAQRGRPGPGDRARHRAALPAGGRGAGRCWWPRRGSSSDGTPSPAARRRRATIAVDGAAVPLGLAVLRALPPRADDPLRGVVRQAAWRLGATGLGGALLGGAEARVAHALDDRLRLRRPPRRRPARDPRRPRRRLRRWTGSAPASTPSSADGRRRRRRALSSARASRPGSSAASPASAYGEHALADLARPPAGRGAARAAGALAAGGPRAASSSGSGVGASAVWHRAMRRIEAVTSADVPVLEAGEADRWVPPTVSGGPGSLVSWAGLGRDGRLHALATVRPKPLPTAPAGVPGPVDRDRHGRRRPVPRPCRSTSGWTTRATPRERVDLAMAELERTGALRPVAARARLPDRHRLRQLRRHRRRCSTSRSATSPP